MDFFEVAKKMAGNGRLEKHLLQMLSKVSLGQLYMILNGRMDFMVPDDPESNGQKFDFFQKKAFFSKKLSKNYQNHLL